jgi:hypothetical protein
MKSLRTGRCNFWKPETEVIGESKRVISSTGKVATKSNSAVHNTELRNTALDFWAEVSHKALDRPRSSVTQGTDCTTFNLFPAFFLNGIRD